MRMILFGMPQLNVDYSHLCHKLNNNISMKNKINEIFEKINLFLLAYGASILIGAFFSFGLIALFNVYFSAFECAYITLYSAFMTLGLFSVFNEVSEKEFYNEIESFMLGSLYTVILFLFI